MTGTDSIDPADREERHVRTPILTVIDGLTYVERSQVFKRWCLPTYETSFRWTGNQPDAEDATSWVFKNLIGRLRLPELVSAIDERVAEATLEAAIRHWSDRYGLAPYACEAYLSGRPALSLDALVSGLSAELRLMIVLRFLRKRTLPAIAGQLGIPAGALNVRLYAALSQVAERLGLDSGMSDLTQADRVVTFVDHLIDRRRPPRFEARPAAWAVLLAAAQIQAAVAGNDIPRAEFVRSLQEAVRTGRNRSHVTHVRIWNA
jgi:hypothetical protein